MRLTQMETMPYYSLLTRVGLSQYLFEVKFINSLYWVCGINLLVNKYSKSV